MIEKQCSAVVDGEEIVRLVRRYLNDRGYPTNEQVKIYWRMSDTDRGHEYAMQNLRDIKLEWEEREQPAEREYCARDAGKDVIL